MVERKTPPYSKEEENDSKHWNKIVSGFFCLRRKERSSLSREDEAPAATEKNREREVKRKKEERKREKERRKKERGKKKKERKKTGRTIVVFFQNFN